MSFDFISLLKLFGKGYLEREFSNLLHKHVTSAGYKTMGATFQAGAQGCTDGDPDEVATALCELLFSIH